MGDWDLLRLHQLLTDEEFEIVSECIGFVRNEAPSIEELVAEFWGSCGFPNPEAAPDDWPEYFEISMEPTIRAPQAIACFLREALLRNMHQDSRDKGCWGLHDRLLILSLGLITQMLHAYECTNQILNSPLPLPYQNLCKTLLCTFLFSLPLCIDFRLGFFANTILPLTISTIVLGLDVIATELANPFGDDCNDLDILELIHTFEREVVTMLALTGDKLAVDRLCWRRVPIFVNQSSCSELKWQLVVKAYAAPEVVVAYSEGTSQSEASDLELEDAGTESPRSEDATALE